LSLASSFLFGLVPALRAARGSISGTLREGGRGFAGFGGDWLRPSLLAAEVALSVLLLVGAGLLIRSGQELQRVHAGFDPTGVLTARIALPAIGYNDAERVVATFERFAEETGTSPGVRFAAVSSQIPMSRGSSTNGLVAEGKPPVTENIVDSRLGIVTGDYFRALSIPILRGRSFTSADRRGAQKVMIVSETLAATLFPGQDPIGRRVSCCEGGPDGGPDYKLVIGVAADLRSRGLAEDVYPEFYLPIAQAPSAAWDWVQRSMYIVARTGGKPEAAIPTLRRITAAIDPDVPLYDVLTMDQRMAESLATARFNTLLLTILGCFGLLLAAGGIYGVAAYFVTQRTAEIGVRMALGATRRDVLKLVLWRAILPVAAGVLLGLGASAAATRVLAASLVGVGPTDPLTLAAVILVLVATALLASVFPARRAASVEPTRALQAA